MWGFGIYLMRLADYFAGRKKNKKCDVCGQKFGSIDKMEEHRREVHPNMPPKENSRDSRAS